jgi:hypothetical protein
MDSLQALLGLSQSLPVMNLDEYTGRVPIGRDLPDTISIYNDSGIDAHSGGADG